ncbi:oligosaccharide flippase family protein [Metabacillus sp. RGM 3146]|uniref:oligosaccharide flippase family protein n=1 Tax=Metabacillus sp. RGM 3146 TaxID=3401092 RepID=UPI003B9BA107
MLNQLKRLGGDSLLYAFMNVGTKIIAFFMLPIYTSYLGTERYGLLGVMDNYTSLLTFMVIFGTDAALAYYYFNTKDANRRLLYVRNVMNLRLAIIVLSFAAVFVLSPVLPNLLFKTDLYNSSQLMFFIYINLIILLLDTVGTLILTVLRYEYKTIKVVVFTVLKMALIAALSYVILRFFMKDIEGALFARIISGALIILFLLRQAASYFRFQFDREVMRDMLRYGAPLVPASLSFWVIISSNSVILQFIQSPVEVGLYQAAIRFAALISLVTSGIQMAWRPYSMSMKDKPNAKEMFSKVYIIILVLGAFGILGVATVMPFVIKMLNAEFHTAYQYVPLLSAATFLNFYYLIISVGIFILKKTKYITYAFVAGAIIDVVLNLVLVPFYSIWGSVAAYLLSYMAAIVYIFYKSQKIYYVPVSFMKLSILFLGSVAGSIYMVYSQLNQLPWWHIAIVWLVFLVLLGITRVDKDLLRKNTVQSN